VRSASGLRRMLSGPAPDMSEWRRSAFGLVLGLLLLVGSACQPFHRGPEDVSLAQLATRQEAYDGHQVHTRGVVRKLQDIAGPYYYVIEDADQHDAELQPGSSAADYEGRQVEVVGLFHFSERSGRSITIDQMDVTGTTSR